VTEYDPLSRYDLAAAPSILSEGAILETAELARVRALPERPPIDTATVDALSRALCPGGAGRLREHQALALRELYQVGGLIAPLKVGAGKTLITLLAPTILGAERAVLVVPASLREKTRRDFAQYRLDGWDVRMPDIISFAKLGQPNAEDELRKHAPELILFDEAHKLKNLKSASSVRRVARAIKELRPRVAMLSGSMMGAKLMEYWHLFCWALGPSAPVPLVHAEAKRWALALDRDTDGMRRCEMGALASLGDFHEFARSRRGMVPTMGGGCDAKILLHEWDPGLPPELDHVIAEVAATRTRPDGELLEDTELADCLQQLAQGFWYRWDPQPPDWWLDPRRDWNAYVRQVLDRHLDGFDSPAMVVAALDYQHGIVETKRWARDVLPQFADIVEQAEEANPDFEIPDEWLGEPYEVSEQEYRAKRPEPPDAAIGRHLLARWREVRDTYKATTVAEWIDDAPLKAAIERAGDECIIWTRHRAAGERLRQLGVPFFGADTNPAAVAGKRTIACSIQAHGTGKNLQAWSKNLILTMPANATTAEQLMGRTHRPGQKSAEVSFDVYASIDYHRSVLQRVKYGAEAAGQAAGIDFKIIEGTWV
jgi:hypothetical protein